jgi:hypothetical protein
MKVKMNVGMKRGVNITYLNNLGEIEDGVIGRLKKCMTLSARALLITSPPHLSLKLRFCGIIHAEKDKTFCRAHAFTDIHFFA